MKNTRTVQRIDAKCMRKFNPIYQNFFSTITSLFFNNFYHFIRNRYLT